MCLFFKWNKSLKSKFYISKYTVLHQLDGEKMKQNKKGLKNEYLYYEIFIWSLYKKKKKKKTFHLKAVLTVKFIWAQICILSGVKLSMFQLNNLLLHSVLVYVEILGAVIITAALVFVRYDQGKVVWFCF